MIGLGLCRIGVGMAGVVLSYRVTLCPLLFARFARDASSRRNGVGTAGMEIP